MPLTGATAELVTGYEPTAWATARGAANSTLPLQVTRLRYRVGRQVLLTDVTFCIDAPSCNLILGPNGAGKSLLMRLCHGLLKPTDGTLDWNGWEIRRARSRHAMVFQQPVLLRRSVAANIDYVLRLRGGVTRRERRSLVAEALTVTGLVPLAQRPARRLSGGEQQRLALARAWVMTPEVLLLDEPTANLDPRSVRAIEQLILELRRNGTTVVMTTHDMAQARRMAERVLFLNRGCLVEDAPAAAFFEQPASWEARMFLAGKLLV